jgi:hypothetical protein
MRIFPTERARQRADTRTVKGFFAAIAIVTLLFGLTIGVHYLLGWW